MSTDHFCSAQKLLKFKYLQKCSRSKLRHTNMLIWFYNWSTKIVICRLRKIIFILWSLIIGFGRKTFFTYFPINQNQTYKNTDGVVMYNLFLSTFFKLTRYLLFLSLRSWKSGRFENMFSFGNSHPIVIRGSRVSGAPPHHTLPDFLNLNGRN